MLRVIQKAQHQKISKQRKIQKNGEIQALKKNFLKDM